ncbi:MAG: hypothetical protein R6U96_08070 [Promethearchaeia archaeon]
MKDHGAELVEINAVDALRLVIQDITQKLTNNASNESLFINLDFHQHLSSHTRSERYR